MYSAENVLVTLRLAKQLCVITIWGPIFVSPIHAHLPAAKDFKTFCNLLARHSSIVYKIGKIWGGENHCSGIHKMIYKIFQLRESLVRLFY